MVKQLREELHLPVAVLIDTKGPEIRLCTFQEPKVELKAGEREILYLIYYEGFSTRETASLLGISQTAVTTRLQRARKKLRERLEEEGRP